MQRLLKLMKRVPNRNMHVVKKTEVFLTRENLKGQQTDGKNTFH